MSNDAQAVIAGIALFIAAIYVARFLAKKLRQSEPSPETQRAIDEFERKRKEGPQ